MVKVDYKPYFELSKTPPPPPPPPPIHTPRVSYGIYITSILETTDRIYLFRNIHRPEDINYSPTTAKYNFPDVNMWRLVAGMSPQYLFA